MTRLLLLFAIMMQLACPPSPPPPLVEKIDFDETLERLTGLKNSLFSTKTAESIALIDGLTKSLPESFPLKMDRPFMLNEFYTLLMNDTRAIKAKANGQLTTAWQDILKVINGKRIYNQYQDNFRIDISVLKSVLSGKEPLLIYQLRTDLTTMSAAELNKRNEISWDSFWRPAISFNEIWKEGTGAVFVTHDGNLVGFLEFRNKLSPPKVIDLQNQSDLVTVVPTTPGYVSWVARRAAYAGFDIERKLFEKFFDYARGNNITESYSYVRKDDSSAILLLESLGYQIVANIPLHPSNPPIGAYVMRKTL